MIKLLYRYISQQLILSSLMILLLLGCLQSLFGFLNELADTGEGNYQLSDAILYTALMLPGRLLELFPMSVLVGTLTALGNMATNSELTVMRAAGVTTWRIAGWAISGSLFLVLCVIAISEWVAPITTKSAQQIKTAALSGGEVTIAETGVWAKRDSEIIHLGEIYKNNRLEKITIYRLADGRLQQMIEAQSATMVDGVWQLKEVKTTRFTEQRIEVEQQPEMVWLRPLQQEQINTLTLEPETMRLKNLLGYIDYLKKNKLDSKSFELEAWRNIAQPFSIAVMIFLATSFVFGPMRDISMGARILSGVMLGFGFHLASQSFGPISLVYKLPPFFGAFLPLLIFSLLGYWLMKRTH